MLHKILNDQNELLKIVERLNNLLGTDDYVLVADHGFWKIKHIKEIYGTNVMIIIPDRGAASRQKTIIRLKNKISVKPEEINENTLEKYNFIFNRRRCLPLPIWNVAHTPRQI